jgi:DNA-binding NarL/FixJ family response regulator
MSEHMPMQAPDGALTPQPTSRRVGLRVLLVDDHPIVRQGLRRVLEQEGEFLVVGEAETADQGHCAIEQLNPEVVLADLQLRDGDGIEFVRRVRARRPQLPILVISMHEESVFAEPLIAAGANGYIMKQQDHGELVSALRCVVAGGTYVSESIGQLIIQHRVQGRKPAAADPIDTLSYREVQVLRMIGAGMTSRETAQSLHLSVKTIESHRQRIKQKLRLTKAAQLVRYAISWNARLTSAEKDPQAP